MDSGTAGCECQTGRATLRPVRRPRPGEQGQDMEPIRIKPISHTTRKVWVRRGAFAVVGLIAVGVLASIVAPPLLARAARAVLHNKVAEVARSLGREVIIERVTSGLSDALVVEGVEIRSRDGRYAVLSVEQVEMDFSLWDALMGRRAPSRVEMRGVRGTVRLEGGRPREVLDLARGLLQWSASSSGQDSLSQARSRIVPEVKVLGEVVVQRDRDPEPVARLEQTVVTMQRSEDGLSVRVSLVAKGLSADLVRITGHVTARSSRDFRLEFHADRPVEPTTLFSDLLPFAARATGFSVTATPSHTEVGVQGVEVPELASLKGWPIAGQFLSHAGLLSVPRIRATFSEDALVLVRSGPSKIYEALRAVTVEGGSAHLVPALPTLGPIRLRSLNATLNRDPGGSRVLRMVGEATGGRLGFSRFEALLTWDPQHRMNEARLSVAGPLTVEVASGLHPRLLPWPGARVDFTAIARGDGRRWAVTGHVAARGLTYFWTKVCLVPVTDIGFDADVWAQVDFASGEVSARLDPLVVGPARFAVDLKVSSLHRVPRYEVAFTIPKQSCDAVFRAIPRVLVPRLDGAVFEGVMGLEARLIADLERPDRSGLHVVPDVEGCRAVTLGSRVDVDKLNSDRFVFEIREKDLDEPIRVGPGTPSYVPIQDIPVVVQQAALATEDMAFFRHEGFRIGLINRAIKLNLGEGWYVYGGSTISQQLVKNLFLSREKTLARKLEEAIIVWDMERKVEKERILELYLNCIEFGKHVYGIRAAAETYFGKDVRDLTPMDAAFIMATKPGPRYAHKVYESRSFNEWWVKRMKGILERLWREMGVIDERAARTPDPCPPDGPRGRYLVPCFYYPKEGIYTQPSVAPGTEIPPGMPENLPGGETPTPTRDVSPAAGPTEPTDPPPGAEPGTP